MSNEEFLKKISEEGEEWRPVVGWESLYAVSNLGRVAFLNRTTRQTQGTYHIKPKLCKFMTTKFGYIQARLWLNNKEKKKYVHRLVADAFIPNPNNYPQIDHIDTDKTNNQVRNLRWCTSTMNHLNPITRARNSASKKGHPVLIEKMSVPVVRINPKDPTDYKIYESAKKAGEIEGFNWNHISDVCRGVRNKTQGFYWKYLSDFQPPINDVNVLNKGTGD